MPESSDYWADNSGSIWYAAACEDLGFGTTNAAGSATGHFHFQFYRCHNNSSPVNIESIHLMSCHAKTGPSNSSAYYSKYLDP